MTPELWSRVRELVETAAELPDREAARYLDECCDAELRLEVDSLLAACHTPNSFLDEPQYFPEMFTPPGTRIGPYTIESPAGCGGMGVVYRARDERLGRTVALKLLPIPIHDVDLLKEARAVSSLNHPNIVTVHDIVEYHGATVMVMEFVEGRTLGELLAEGPLDAELALSCARQIASALAASHDAGLVHRDLKPSNVMVRGDGAVRILDFGIARPPGDGDVLALGTRGYVSPEQIAGRPVDLRSDIFAFGALLREMLPPKRPARLRRLIGRCLEDDPGARPRSMREVVAALRSPLVSRRFAAAAAVLMLAAAALAGRLLRDPITNPVTRHITRLSPNDEWTYSRPVISPDGRFVAYLSDRLSGIQQLWLQSTGSGEPVQLTNAPRGVNYPSFTPDGRSLVYIRRSAGQFGNCIEVIPTLGGEPRTLVEDERLFLNTVVSPDGRWVAYIDSTSRKVMTVPLAGGEPKAVAPSLYPDLAWAPDSRRLILWTNEKSSTAEAIDDWGAFPIAGGEPVATGMRSALQQALGMKVASPGIQLTAIFQDRAIFRIVDGEQTHPWEVRFLPATLHAKGVPRQLASGTERETIFSVNGSGMAALQARHRRTDLYDIPINVAEGSVNGEPRRLTADARVKTDLRAGHSGEWVSFRVRRAPANYSVLRSLTSGKEIFSSESLDFVVTPDERSVVDTPREGEGASVRVSPMGRPQQTRKLCSQCGRPGAATPDARFVQLDRPAEPAKSRRHASIWLLDVESGKVQPWIALDGTGVATVPEGFFGRTEPWMIVSTGTPGTENYRRYVLPWRMPAPARSEWVEVPKVASDAHVTAGSDLLFYIADAKLQTLRFDPRARRFSTAGAVKGVVIDSDDWAVHPGGVVYSKTEIRSSVWLMKLPE